MGGSGPETDSACWARDMVADAEQVGRVGGVLAQCAGLVAVRIDGEWPARSETPCPSNAPCGADAPTRVGSAHLMTNVGPDWLVALLVRHVPRLEGLDIAARVNSAALAPRLARLPHLTSLDLREANFAEPLSPEVPHPAFCLRRLSLVQGWQRAGSALASFEWTTASSRRSPRHLALDGRDSAILDSIRAWGQDLDTLQFHLSPLESIQDMVALARLSALRQLTVVMEVVESADAPLQDASAQFGAEMSRAVGQIDEEFGREVVVTRPGRGVIPWAGA